MDTRYYDHNTLKWIDLNQLRTSKGELFEWKDHEFLLDPICDWHPSQAIIKSSQIGWSETAILKAFYAAKVKKYNIIYTLPTDQFLEKFVPPKVNKIIENNPLSLADVSGNMSLKSVGHGLDQRFINFTGTYNSKSDLKKEETSKGISYTSDLNIHDEASRSDQFVINQMRSRLDNSLYKGRWLFDNPTYPLMGADSVYQKSDQHHWIVKCDHCGYRQYLDWCRLDKIDYQSGTTHCWVDTIKKQFICGKCKQELSDEVRRTGEWVAKFPERTEYRGYWMPQMIYVRHHVRDILEKEEDVTLEKSFFHNFVLAKPYTASDIKVNRENIIANMDGEKNWEEQNAMGVDQGNMKHYVIGNTQGIFKVGKTESWQEIKYLFEKYQCKMVVDALPYQQVPRQMSTQYKNRVWRAFYKPESDQRELSKFADNGTVLIRREECFDAIVDLIQAGEFPIQVSLTNLEEYINHWESLVKIVEPDKIGNDRFRWTSVNGIDHYAHATLYWYIALQKAKLGFMTRLKIKTQEPKRREGAWIRPDGTVEQSVLDEFVGKNK